MAPPNKPALLTFKFPNMWQNRLGDKLRIVAAFTPIDDDNSMVYVRSYQWVKRPNVVNRAVARVTAQFNKVILREDQRAVETQRPKIAGLDIGGRFIPGDRPIALFLIHHRDLILAAQKGTQLASGAESVADADAEIDWSMSEEGAIDPNLPQDLRRKRQIAQIYHD